LPEEGGGNKRHTLLAPGALSCRGQGSGSALVLVARWVYRAALEILDAYDILRFSAAEGGVRVVGFRRNIGPPDPVYRTLRALYLSLVIVPVCN
jgi:hypothetical protein